MRRAVAVTRNCAVVVIILPSSAAWAAHLTLRSRGGKLTEFVYETVRLVEQPRLTLEERVPPRRRTRATCSQCRRPAPGYDTLPPRRFDFVPLWHIPVAFVYAMRRVSCPSAA